jgi:hypothetical protein
MPPLSRLLWRLLVASFGWLVAIAGSVATVIGASMGRILVATDLPLPAVDPHGVVELALVFTAAAKGVWLGWFVFALYAEIVGLRSLLAHLFVFAAIALLGVVALAPVEVTTCIATVDIDCGRTMVDTVMRTVPGAVFKVLAAAGFVAGFGYWLVAGGSAGFREPPTGFAPRKGDAQPPHA